MLPVNFTKTDEKHPTACPWVQDMGRLRNFKNLTSFNLWLVYYVWLHLSAVYRVSVLYIALWATRNFLVLHPYNWLSLHLSYDGTCYVVPVNDSDVLSVKISAKAYSRVPDNPNGTRWRHTLMNTMQPTNVVLSFFGFFSNVFQQACRNTPGTATSGRYQCGAEPLWQVHGDHAVVCMYHTTYEIIPSIWSAKSWQNNLNIWQQQPLQGCPFGCCDGNLRYECYSKESKRYFDGIENSLT